MKSICNSLTVTGLNDNTVIGEGMTDSIDLVAAGTPFEGEFAVIADTARITRSSVSMIFLLQVYLKLLRMK